MRHHVPKPLMIVKIACASLLASACGGGGDVAPPPPPPAPPPEVTVTVVGPNAVSEWNETAAATISLPAAATGTAEERGPSFSADLATVHIAIYDAVMAITGTHKPYAITPRTAAAGASQEAAVGSAAYRMLLGMFPNRSAQYQAKYDSFMAALPDGEAKTQGIAVGAEVASAILGLRAADGRSTPLAAYVPGTTPGVFRGVNPINRAYPLIRPFVLNSHTQFRAPGPPALDSAAYAADLAETRALGMRNSPTRTAEQLEAARFHSENPAQYMMRNLRRFAMTDRSLAEHARLMALLWTTMADSSGTCFESKYHYQFWRPTSAINLAASNADTTWAPELTTPNHPEYPAAHSCGNAAVGEILTLYYGTPKVSFEYSSMVTNTTRSYSSPEAMLDEVQIARIAGGMHFRTATVDGAALGRGVANWVWTHAFQPR